MARTAKPVVKRSAATGPAVATRKPIEADLISDKGGVMMTVNENGSVRFNKYIVARDEEGYTGPLKNGVVFDREKLSAAERKAILKAVTEALG